jgi:SHAQKYF class myb-like DNA-binding protein
VQAQAAASGSGDDEEGNEDDGGRNSRSGGSARSGRSSSSSSGGDKACAAGSETTGRWTKQEHEMFLKALRKFGKEWKKVAAMVKTRTVVQTRTHAQKYFQKLQKLQQTGEVCCTNDKQNARVKS